MLASQPRVLDSLGLDVNGLTPDRVLEELIYVGMGDIAELFDDGGNLRPIHEIPAHARRMIAGLDVRNMVDEIRLTPGDGTLAIDVKANLAAMLNAASPSDDWQRQITLVAGAGFEPELM